jgi:Poly(3-hydroxybutyrate) depolymerase
MKKLILFAIFATVLASCQPKEILFTTGTGEVGYICGEPFEGDSLTIFYHIPEGDIATMPVQIVMHGMNRNGDGYRDAWIEKADEYGFAVIVPTFTEDKFPELVYQQGNVKNEDGSLNPKEKFIYVMVDRVFDYFIDHSESKAKTYNIYGHSAGGQFVHRFLLFNDTPKVNVAVAANPGWYTFPTDTIDYPYGIGDAESTYGLDIPAFYAKEMTILLGDADTLRTSNLRQTPEADAQGMYRLARGENFYAFCKADAERRGVAFNWKKAYVQGSNHSNKKMAPLAADIIYGGEQN